MKGITLSVLIGGILSISSQSQADSTRSGTANSMQQQGGLTAGYIENIHLDDLPFEPKKRNFSLKLIGYHNFYSGLLQKNTHTALMVLDSADPLIQDVPGFEVGYNFQILDIDPTESLPNLAACEVKGQELWLIGIRYRSVDAHGRLQIFLEPVKKQEQWLLNSLCAGLNQPFSWLSDDLTEKNDDNLTVGDVVFSDGNPSSFALLSEKSYPGAVEYNIVYHYWREAFGGLLNSLAMVDTNDPKIALAILRSLKSETEVSLPINVDTPVSPDLTPDKVTKDYGELLSELEARWKIYLNSHPILIDGKEIVDEKNSHNIVLQRFNRKSIGSRDFWVFGNRMYLIRYLVNCRAADFLVDQGYVGVRSVPDYGACGANASRN